MCSTGWQLAGGWSTRCVKPARSKPSTVGRFASDPAIRRRTSTAAPTGGGVPWDRPTVAFLPLPHLSNIRPEVMCLMILVWQTGSPVIHAGPALQCPSGRSSPRELHKAFSTRDLWRFFFHAKDQRHRREPRCSRGDNPAILRLSSGTWLRRAVNVGAVAGVCGCHTLPPAIASPITGAQNLPAALTLNGMVGRNPWGTLRAVRPVSRWPTLTSAREAHGQLAGRDGRPPNANFAPVVVVGLRPLDYAIR
jgi:hypothetical protein